MVCYLERFRAALIAGIGLLLLSAFPAHAQWWVEREAQLNQIGANSYTQGLGNYGNGVNVGILDTPIYEDNPLLNIVGSIDLHPEADIVSSIHGTHVAGIVGGGLGIGVASGVNLFDVSVLTPQGYGAQEASVRRAMTAAYGADISIANMSFGYGKGYTLDKDEYFAIRAYRKHILVVKAAGNDGLRLTSVRTRYGGEKTLENLMLVGSVDSNNRISGFSNRPGNGCFARKVKVKVKRKRGRRARSKKRWRCRKKDQYKYFFIVAPGENVWSTASPGYVARLSGTSMAAPTVAGAAALLQGRWAHLRKRPAATANILFRSATDLGRKGVDSTYGWGLLNIERAFQPVGTQYLYSGKKKYPRRTTGLRKTGRLRRMIGGRTGQVKSLSVFDEFDRDFSLNADSVVTPIEPGLGERLVGMLSDLGNPAYETVNSSRSFTFNDAIAFSYSVTTARELDPSNPEAVRESAVESYLNATNGVDPTGTWRFSMQDTQGSWSLFSGSSGETSPFSFTGMQDYELAGMGSGEDIENPVLGIVDDGTYVGSSLSPVEGIEFTFGLVDGTSEDFITTTYDTMASVAGIKLALSDNVKLGVAVTRLQEDNGMFTAVGSGGLSLGDRFETDAMTFSTDISPADNWLISAAYSVAKTSQTGASDLLALNGSILSDASAIAVARMNLFSKGDRLSMTASMPLATIAGTGTSRLASHLDENGNMVYVETAHDLVESERPVELSFGYLTPLGFGELRLGAVAEFNSRETSSDEFGGFAAYGLKF